jgi:hypothetical protein
MKRPHRLIPFLNTRRVLAGWQRREFTATSMAALGKIISRSASLHRLRLGHCYQASRTLATAVKDDRFVNLLEVAPRDGLQNEPKAISVDDKVELVDRLAKAGFKNVGEGKKVRWYRSLMVLSPNRSREAHSCRAFLSHLDTWTAEYLT